MPWIPPKRGCPDVTLRLWEGLVDGWHGGLRQHLNSVAPEGTALRIYVMVSNNVKLVAIQAWFPGAMGQALHGKKQSWRTADARKKTAS